MLVYQYVPIWVQLLVSFLCHESASGSARLGARVDRSFVREVPGGAALCGPEKTGPLKKSGDACPFFPVESA